MIKVDVCINAPLIVVPFIKNYKNHCWGVEMGRLRLSTEQSVVSTTTTRDKIEVEKYIVKLENLNAGWYSDQELMLKQHRK